MSSKNGISPRVVTTLILILWAALSGVIVFMGSTVRANDDKATTEHTAIRKESKQDDDKLRKELMGEVFLLRNEQKIMRKESNASFTKVLVAIEKIKK